MGKMATTLDGKLPEFQKYLLEKNLAPAKNVPFYAHWISRFLDYARRNEFSALEYQESTVLGFLEFLKSDSPVQDWQHRQASDSPRLFYFHFLDKTDTQSAKAVASEISPILSVRNAGRNCPLFFRWKRSNDYWPV
jgi:hypothetical protein